MKRKNKPSALAVEYKATLRDADLDKVLTALQNSGLGYTFIANKSGVAVGTLRRWAANKTRKPQHITMRFALRAIGGHFAVVVPEKKP